MKPAQYKLTSARHIMVYGPPKIGKTLAALSLAKYGYKLWYLDGEDSIKSLWAVDENGKRIIEDEHLDNIEIIKMPDTAMFPIMAATVQKVIKGGPCKICHDHGAVSCKVCEKSAPDAYTLIDTNTFTTKDILVIDSVTQLGSSLIAVIKKDDIRKDTELPDLKLDFNEWGKQGFALDRIFSQVQTAKYNIIAISHEELVEMNDKSKDIVPKMGTRNFSKTSAKYFDDIVYMTKVNNRLSMFSSTTYKDSVQTGSRTGKMVERKESRGLIELFE